MKSIVWIGVGLIGFTVIAGCGVSKQSSNDIMGSVLGWNNQLYKIVSAVSSSVTGQKLGKETFHGPISGQFTVFQMFGSDPSKEIVFETSNGHYYEAVVTNQNK